MVCISFEHVQNLPKGPLLLSTVHCIFKRFNCLANHSHRISQANRNIPLDFGFLKSIGLSFEHSIVLPPSLKIIRSSPSSPIADPLGELLVLELPHTLGCFILVGGKRLC